MSRMLTDPTIILMKGVDILRPVLEQHGFAFSVEATGKSSGGSFASGQFVRGDRRLELHVRHSLGLVQYHIGEVALDHESFLRYSGHWNNRNYPGYSPDPLSSFKALAKDLSAYCSDFLCGAGDYFRNIAAEYVRNPNRFKGFNALGKPGV